MELIDKRKAVESIEKIATALENNGNNAAAVITRLNAIWIMSQPTVEAEPVRHGRWEEEDERSAYRDFAVSCSECGAFLDIHKALHFKYCYNCGAKMDGGVSDDREKFACGKYQTHGI